MADAIPAEIKTKTTPPWTFLYCLISIIGIFLYHRLDYAFTNYVFGDIGASWHAVRLIRAGKLPGVDFAYQYGAFSLGFFDLALRFLGDSPKGCYAFGTLAVVALVTIAIAFSAKIKATGPAWIIAIVWAVASQRVLFLSSAHALEPIVLSLAVLCIAFGKKRWAMILCTVGWFVKPAMAIVMLAMIFAWRLLDESFWKSRLKLLFNDACIVLITFLTCFAISAIWLGWQSASTMLFPVQGAGVYKALRFGFFHGVGSSMWYVPGASPAYYLGTQSASWLALNVVNIAIAAAVLVRFVKMKRSDRTFRDSTGELTVFLVLAHSAFVCLFYGQLWSWMYYAWMLWMATISGFSWLFQFPRFQKKTQLLSTSLVALSLLGNYTNFRQVYDSMRMDQPVEMKFGLYASPEFRLGWQEMKQEMKPEPVCISLLIGYGQGVLGEPFFSPDYWCIAPGDTFQPMFDEWDRSIQRADQIVFYMHENLDYFEGRKKEIENEFEIKYKKQIGSSGLELWHRKQSNEIGHK